MTPGDRIGPYELVASLGAGGMGEVYRATDTRLKRQVALKVLPADVAADPERLARLEREAQVLASLNHPGIAAIYGVEETPATKALVLELVEGATLADRIARPSTFAQGVPSGVEGRGLPLADALPIAKQIAEALEAAHEHGIIHRDLKPANIKVRDDGTVKVLDFGLAKAFASDATAAGISASMSPTLSIHATQAGVILGTAAYMSPEQAAGKPVDKRTDLWSFGVVFLEMLTGRRVFDGETTSHVLAAVLKDAPDFSALPADTPASIRKLLKRCLEKDRRKRLADAADARLEIEDALAGAPLDQPSVAVSSPAAATRTWTKRAPVLLAFAAGAVVAGAAALFVFAQKQEPAARALTYTPLSFEPGGNMSPVWSPDGKGVAFAARQSEDEPFQVYVRYLDSSTSTQLTHAAAAAQPVAWTKAGRVVFRTTAAPGGLWSISQTGGQPEPLLALPNDEAGLAAVSPDGTAIVYHDYQLLEGRKKGVWISAPAGSPPKEYLPAPFAADVVTNRPSLQFSPDGTQLLVIRNATRGEEAWLMPYPPDASRPPHQIFQNALGGSTGTPEFSWMPDNRRVVMSFSSGSEPRRLYLADTVTGTIALLSSGTTAEDAPAVSPDGSRLAFVETNADLDVLQVDIASGIVAPLVVTRRTEDMPGWAANAGVLAYRTDRTGEQEIWVRESGRPDRPVVTARDFPGSSTLWFWSPEPSPDGRRIIYGRIDSGASTALWLSSLTGGAPVRVTNAGPKDQEAGGSWSPDGAWFVYWSYGLSGMNLQRVRTTGNASPEVVAAKVVPLSEGLPVWAGEWILYDDNGWRMTSADGKTKRDLAIKAIVCTLSGDASLVYCVRSAGSGGELFSRSVAGGPERVVAKLTSQQTPNSGLSPARRMVFAPDGRHLAFSVLKRETSLWLLNGIGGTRP